MSFRRIVRAREAPRRWPLLLAYAALVVSCDSQLGPESLGVERVEVAPSVAELVPGGSQTVTARVFNTDGAQVTGRRVFWSSQNPAVATVTQAGVITAVGTGTTQVAASSGGRSGIVAVTVQPRPVALVRVTPNATNVVAGATVRLTAEPLDGTGAVIPGRVVAWSSGDAAIATVDNTGLVTGVSPGNVTIRATAGGIDGSASVTVVPAPIASIDLAPGVVTLNVGESVTLAATPRDAAGQALTGRQLTWSSSDNTVATVSSAGAVTGIASGPATITVSAPGAGPGGTTPSRTAQITVLLPAVSRVQVAPATASVSIGGTTNFAVSLFDANDQPLGTAGRVVAWASSNTAVATINGVSGVATGVATGTTTITATVSTPGRPGSQQGSASLTVSTVPVATVTVSPNPAVVHAGTPYARTFSAVPKDAQGTTLSGRTVVWTSSNQSVATVDATTGLVTGVTPGTSRIRAVSEGKEGFVDATVDLVPILTTQVTPPTASLVPPQTAQLGAVPLDSAGNVISGTALGSRTSVWSTSNAGVATVSVNGLVTAVAPGTATITGAFGGIIGQSTITVSAVPVASVTVTPSAPSVVVGSTVQLTASAFSAGGAPLPGRPFVWSTSDAARATVDQNGLVTGVLAGGPVRIIATVEGKADTADVTVTPRPATKLGMATQPSASAQSGVPLGVQPAVQLLDATNAAVAQAGVVVTASIGSGTGTLGGTLSATTNASGVATFTNLVITGTAGSNTLTFGATGLTSVTSSAIVLGAGGPSKLGIVQQPSATAQSGVAFVQQPTVRVLDAANNPVAQAGIVVSATIATGGGTVGGTTTATTDATGLASFTTLSISGPVPGPFTLRFQVSGLTDATSSAITLSAGSASQLAMHTQPSASAQSGVALSVPPAVRLRDAAGNAVSTPGVSVSVSVSGPGAVLGGTTVATTDASGIATFGGLSLSGVTGSYTLSFSSGALTGVTSNPIALGAGSGAQFTLTTQPSSTAVNDVAFVQQPVLQLRDASGNAVAQAGVSVTASVASGGGTLGGTVTVNTNASGVAAFTNLKLTGTVGPRTLQFTSVHPTVTSASVTVTAGAASQIVLSTAPSATASSGVPLLQQPVLQLRDVSGNDVPQGGVAVTASLPGGSAATLSGATVGTSASGTATFSALTLTGSAGSYVVTFTAGALNVQAPAIALSAGSGSKLAVVTQPSSTAPNGAAFAQQPSVRLLDASDNPVLQAGVTITAAIATGSPALGGTTSAITDANGIATFTNLSITGTAGTRTLLFASGSFLSATSSTINITAGPATNLQVVTQPSATAQSGIVLAQQPAVQLRDVSNNPVTQAGVVISASIASGGGTLGGTLTATTDASGTAAFSTLALSGAVPGPYALGFGAPGLTSATSASITLSAGAAAQLAMQTQPSAAAQSGVAFATQPAVRIKDAAGNNVSTAGIVVSVSLNGTGATLNGTLSATTDASGVATFSGLSLSGASGAYTLTFATAGLTSATSSSVTLGSGTATQITLTTQPSVTAANDAPLAQQPVLQLRDAANNPVAQAGVAVTAAIATGGGTLGGTLTVNTDASGVAAFSDLKITGTVGPRTLQFTSAFPTVTSNTVTLTAGAATQLVITSAPSTTASSGAALAQQPVLQLRDVSDNDVPQSGVAVTASLPGGSAAALSGATVGTNASGTATFTALTLTGSAGSYTVTFTAGALTVQAAPITLSAGSGSKLAVITQPSSSAPNGAAFTQQPAVELRDASNNPVLQAGVTVTVAIESGGGTLGGATSAVTNASGVATFTNLSITGTVGARTLIFASSGYISVSSSPITITPGAAAALAIATQPSSTAQSDAAFAQQPAVQIVDASGNAVGQSGVVVTAALATGTGTLGGTTTATTNGSGLATFTGLKITGVAGNFTLGFSSVTPALASPASNTIALSAGTPTQLTITAQPSATAANDVPFAQQPVVQLRDGAGNAVSQGGVNVLAAILTGGGTLGGTTTVATNGSGVATFTDLKITGTPGSRTLEFTSGTLTAATSTAIAVSAGAATQLVLVTPPPATATNGVAFSTQPVLQLRDVSGNDVSHPGLTVSASIATGTGAALTGASVTTDASGTATFTALTLTGTVGNFTLTFAAGALTAGSGTIALGAGAATKLVITTQPSASAQNSASIPQQPVIQLQDVSSNPVPQSGVTVTAAIASGGGTLGGTPTANTDANGTATFTGLSITGTVGDRTLSFTAPSLTGATSNTIAITAGPAASLTLTTQPSASAQVGVAFPTQPVVQLQDVSGNPVSQAGTVVTAAIASGGGTLGGTPTASTNASGTATFTDLQITGSVGDRTLSFSAPSLTSVTSNTIAVGPAPASQVTITTQPSATATNDAPFSQQPVLQLRDAGGNAVPQAGVALTAAIASGGGTLGGATTVNTDASGIATFTNLKITGVVGDRTLSFSASGLTAATSGTVSVTAGAAAALALTTQPSSTSANASPFAQQPVVQLQDISGNAVSQAGVNVTASIAAPGAGTLGGTGTIPTSAAGTASFTDLSITGTVGTYSLDFAATSLTGVTSTAITLTPGAPHTVTVSAPGDSIIGTATLQATATILDSGGNTVTGAPPAWSSSDPAVATVDASSGLITGVTPGPATITATAGGKSDNLSIRVLAAVATVEVTATDSSLYAGQTVQATAVLKDGNGNALTGRPISWSSSNPAKASVNASTGLVTAVDSGTATITASVPTEGKSANFTITVALVPADSVLVSPTTAALTVGATLAFSASAYDSTGAALSGRAFAWSVSNAAKASISSSGTLTALDSGTVVVTATTSPGTSGGTRSDSTTVTITLVPVGSVTASPTSHNLTSNNPSQTKNFTFTVTSAAPAQPLPNRACTVASSDPNSVTVPASPLITDASGQITVTVGVGPAPVAGSKTITVTCDGVQGTATVMVS